MMYSLNDIKIFGYHGVYDNEKSDGQEFLVTLSYKLSESKASISDDLNDVVDYKNVYDDLILFFNKKRFKLLESLSIFICKELKSKYLMDYISIHITKNQPNKLNLLKSVSVKYEC